MRLLAHIVCLLLLKPLLAAAKTHTFYYSAQWISANPDGVKERPVISFNGSWPLPTIEVNRGDRVQLNLHNGLGNTSTSLHFHGLLQERSNHMDGPVYVTQCPIPAGESFQYDFVVDQAGTYWYHSHSGSQYSDGLRGLFIVHDKKIEKNYEFDKELVLSISDWYHDTSDVLVKKQLTRYNPTGAEPVPQNALFNDSKNVSVAVEADTTYLVRIVNIGIMVSQFLTFEGHDIEIIEVDGTYVEPAKTSTIYLAVGQRMSVLLKTKPLSKVKSNFCIVQSFDVDMLDVIPNDLQVNSINYLTYDPNLPNATPKDNYDIGKYKPFDDFKLRPLGNIPLLPEPDHRINLVLAMENLGDGVNYALFNNYSYVAPKVPTLLSALSSPDKYVEDVRIYGSNTNSFVLNYGEIVEIVVNNEDDNKHPFHLHGHQFQTVVRSKAYDEPHHYEPEGPIDLPDFPSMRDTVMVNGNGHLVLRFQANNPGIWFFHCHLDFHLEQGLAVTFEEAPLQLKQQISEIGLPADYWQICAASHTPIKGNAAAHTDDWLNLQGENVQPPPLPLGFTFKGYVAMAICTVVALWGLKSIYVYGMQDVQNESENHVQDERKLLKDLMLKLSREERSLIGSATSAKSRAKKAEIRAMLDELEELDLRFREI